MNNTDYIIGWYEWTHLGRSASNKSWITNEFRDAWLSFTDEEHAQFNRSPHMPIELIQRILLKC